MHFRFRSYFRVSKEIFLHLLGKIEGKVKPATKSISVPAIIKLTAALRFFAEGGYQKGTGNDFNVGLAQSTMSKTLKEILNILEVEICPDLIKFPESDIEKSAIKLDFYTKTGFPGVIGCVDGTHVKIIPPSKEQQHLYYNRKGFHSLNVMVVSTHKQKRET